jgi:tetratricopeptide (TPR) repeat protein
VTAGRAGGMALLVVCLSTSVAAAATPLPLTPPPPDLAPLVPFAEAPLDKPAVAIEPPPLPPPPAELPTLAPLAVALPAGDKPMAFIPSPRTLPCAGAWLRIASESLECGRARLQRGELEEAARALETAVRGSSDRELLREARYWLGEVNYRLGKFEQADWLFRQVAQDAPRQEWGVWSLHSSGWTALRLRDAVRAHDAFTQVLAGPVPAPIEPWARHGLGLAGYALGRYAEALRAWEPLAPRAPPPLARDVSFWYGETLGRVGEPARAEAELARFAQGGPHPLVHAGVLRRGWWALAAGRFGEAAGAFRAWLAAPPPAAAAAADRDLAESGLALALLGAGDLAGAQRGAQALQARRSPLATPLLLRLAGSALAQGRPAEARASVQELLGATLTPSERAWLLLVNGETLRAEGQRDEARTQLGLARTTDTSAPTAWHVALRLALLGLESRQFPQAASDVAPLFTAPGLPPELLAAALLVQGEAAYHAGDHAAAATAYRRVLVEFPRHAQAPAARLAVAWAALRQGRVDEARREFADFAAAHPEHPSAPDALVLGAELAVRAGDLDGARRLVEHVVATYPTHPRTDFARLNRGILLLRAGQGAAARAALLDWLGRAPFPPLFGRAHLGLGAAHLATGDAPGATRAFTLARREGIGALAGLGLGAAALVEARWADAQRLLTEARDTGTAPVAAAADYGLAVVAYHQGQRAAFRTAARAALDAAPRGPRTAALLYVLAGVAAQEQAWSDAMATARRLVDEFPAHDAADDALERVGAAAASARNWPAVYDAYALMAQRYPQSPFLEPARLTLVEAMVATGRPDEARRALEAFVAAAPGDPRTPTAWVMLARLRAGAGDRTGALEAFAQAGRAGSGPAWTRDALRAHADLLAQDRRYDQARAVLWRLLKSTDPHDAGDAARAIGDTYRSEGDHLAAVEFYMTAAYLAPASSSARAALLDAARAYAAVKQPGPAAVLYRKLLAQTDVPADVATAARQELAALGR